MKGRVVVLAGPSGGGKTTIAQELVRRRPDRFAYSVSATTRRPRPGETDGEAYHFLTRDEFQRRAQAGEFLEWAEYAGQRYGTLKHEAARLLASGRHVVLDIEVQGARQVRRAYPRPDSVIVFVIPPSARVLIERLRQRRTESDGERRERLAIAVRELREVEQDAQDPAVFDRVVVNDDLDAAVASVIEIVERPAGGEPRAPEVLPFLADFVRQLERASGQ